MHIGHARTYCFWDTFRRYLEYQNQHVLSVINYTDIDDRLIAQSTDQVGCLDLAERVIASFRTDCRALKIKDYAVYTRATDFIQGQIDAVQALIDKGHAYVIDGEVLYDVQSFERYGMLSGNTLKGCVEGASGRLNEDTGRKRHPADFTLWKPSKPGHPSWKTGKEGWPDGRPGWHIECSVMSTTLLGDHFDVHGGAVDNLFPHHENEIAQSEPLCGHPWVQYWMHPEHLDLKNSQGESVKMSKSLGNVISIPALLETHSPQEVRWFFASTHYRTKLAFTADLIAASAEGYKKISRLVRLLEGKLGAASDDQLKGIGSGTYASLRSDPVPRDREWLTAGAYGELSEKFITRFVEGMNEDVGTPSATAAVFDYVNGLYAAGIEHSEDVGSVHAAYRCLTRHLHVLGVEYPNARLYPELVADCFPSEEAGGGNEALEQVIDRMLELRQAARKGKDFQKADVIRSVLMEAGVVVEDTPKGPRWSLGDQE